MVPRRDRRSSRLSRHLVFALLSSSMLVFVMQFGMIAVALPTLQHDLESPLRWSGWVLTIFLIGQVVALPVVGRLSERLGDSRVFGWSYVGFAAASLGCALAPNVYVLIAGRALQGAAGAGLIPAGTSIIARMYGEGSTRPIGLFTSILPLGAILGPTLGGAIVEGWGWRWTFGISVPPGLLIAAAVLLAVPRAPAGRGMTVDVRGVALLGGAVLSLVFALTELGRTEPSPSSATVAAALGVFVACAVWFVRHERRAESAVVDVDLIRRRPFASLAVIAFVFGFAWAGLSTTLPLYTQVAYGLSPAESGAILSPRAGLMVGAAFVAALALPLTGFRAPLVVGLVGVGVTLMLIGRGLHEPSVAGLTLSDGWWLSIVFGASGLLFGLTNPSMSTAALDLAPERVAAIVGVRAMSSHLGGAIGIGIVVLVASRAPSTASGIEAAATGLGVLLIAITPLVLWVPNRARPKASRGGDAGTAGPGSPSEQGREANLAPAATAAGTDVRKRARSEEVAS